MVQIWAKKGGVLTVPLRPTAAKLHHEQQEARPFGRFPTVCHGY